MKLPDALKSLKSHRGKLHKFFYCEQGEDGKPVLLMNTHVIDKDTINDVLENAKKEVIARGEMTMNEEGIVEVMPAGGAPPNGFLNNMKRIFGSHNALPKEMRLAKPGHADPLRKNAKLDALLDEKGRRQEKLEDRTKHSCKADVEKAEKKLAETEEKIAEEIQRAAKTGLTPKAMHQDFEKEHRQTGWMAWPAGHAPPKPGESDFEVAQRMGIPEQEVALRRDAAKNKATVRRNLTKNEKQQGHLRTEGSQVVNDPAGNSRTEFVANTKGNMTGFHQSRAPGQKEVKDVLGQKVQQTERIHHSSVEKGRPVGFAGLLEIKNGKIVLVSNSSGHYRPGLAETLEFLEYLMREGLLIDNEYVTPEGEPLSGDAKKTYDRALAIQEKLQEQLNQGKLAEFVKDVEQVQLALNFFAKEGYGKKGEIRRNSKVEYVDAHEGMTGAQIKEAGEKAKTNPIPVEQFVEGGNNVEQRQKKANLQEELRAKHKRDEAIEQEAEERAESVAKRLGVPEKRLADLADSQRALEERFKQLKALDHRAAETPAGRELLSRIELVSKHIKALKTPQDLAGAEKLLNEIQGHFDRLEREAEERRKAAEAEAMKPAFSEEERILIWSVVEMDSDKVREFQARKGRKPKNDAIRLGRLFRGAPLTAQTPPPAPEFED